MRTRPSTDPFRQHVRGRPCGALQLGPVRLSVTQVSGAPAPLLGPAGGTGPAMCRLALAGDGPLAVHHGPYVQDLRQGELVLWDSGQELGAAPGGGERTVRVIAWELPRPLLTVPDGAWRRLVGRPVPARWGPAALLGRFLEGLAQQSEELTFRSAGWLGAALVNMTVALVADLAGPEPAPPVSLHRSALLADVKRYVEDHLGDSCLSPGAIAAAHHISPRYLHQLFQADERTVGGYVRELRLERCRADLSDPGLAGRGVGEIRSRWGFGDAAVFCRAFKKAYGMSPAAYRERHASRSGPAGAPPDTGPAHAGRQAAGTLH